MQQIPTVVDRPSAEDDPFPWQARPSLVEEVAQVLRDRIFAGRYPPGEPMRQVQLSEELKVSRTPLREALRVLEGEGLLCSDGVRGVIVARVDLDRLVHAYELREVVDGLAARLAAQRVKTTPVTHLTAIVEQQHKAITPWHPGNYTRLNVQLHSMIISMSANEYLAGQLPLVRLTSQVFAPAVKLTRERAQSAVTEHAEIVDAIARGDATEAEEKARSHIRKTLIRIQAEASHRPY